MINLIKKIINRKKGFTLLFAVLVSVLILSVGISIINLSLKQIVLSGSGRESQYAFYAANTGVECALYWMLNPPEGEYVFPVSEELGYLESADPGTEGVQCAYRSGADRNLYEGLTFGDADLTVPAMVSDEIDGIMTTEFWLGFDDSLPYCAQVIVQRKYIDNGEDDPTIQTQIDSYGYNTCDEENPRRIQRALRVGSIESD